MGDGSANKVKLAKAPVNSTYRNYDEHTREKFIDRMIEGPVKRGRKATIARELGVKYSTAKRWWEHYEETGEVPYKKSERNIGRPRTFTEEHEEYIQEIMEKDP